MIEIHKENVEGIPLLHIVKNKNNNSQLPLIFFVHGFTSAKEHNLHFAYLLAEKGFRVILPEADMHGERSAGLSEKETMFHFWEIVMKTIQELDILKKFFVDNNLADPARIGVVGTSMGGIVTLGAMTQYDWIHTGVSLMGSPNYEQFARAQIDMLKREGIEIPLDDDEMEKHFKSLKQYDLSAQPQTLAGRPIMFWHGKKDHVVPFEPTYRFYETIKRDYEQNSEDLYFMVDEHADHKVSRKALLKTVDWFSEHLLRP